MRVGDFVDQVVPDGARPVDHLRGVRTVPAGSRVREGSAERIDRRPVVLRVAERELVAVIEAVVEPDVVLPLILRVLAVEDRVGGAQLIAGRRQRVGIEQRDPVRRELTRRNDVARERLAGERVGERHRAAEELVRRVQELAEVAPPHRLGRHRGAVGLHGQVVHPFLGGEEEQPVREHRAWNRPAERIAVLLVFEGRRPAVLNRVRAAVPRPRVGLQLVAAQEVRAAAAVAAAAAFRDEPDLAAARAPEFRHVVGRQHLDFLDRVDVLNADDGIARPRSDGGRAVDRDVVLVGAAAVDVVAAVAEVGEAARIEVAPHHARLQTDDTDGIASGKGEQLDVLGLDRLPERDVGLEDRRVAGHRNLFADRAGLQREVDGLGAGRVKGDIGAVRLLEPLQLRDDVVLAGQQVREDVEAGGVGDGVLGLPRLRGRGCDRDAGHHAALLVLDGARDRASVELRERWRRTAQKQHERAGNCSERRRRPMLDGLAPLHGFLLLDLQSGGREDRNTTGPRARSMPSPSVAERNRWHSVMQSFSDRNSSRRGGQGKCHENVVPV